MIITLTESQLFQLIMMKSKVNVVVLDIKRSIDTDEPDNLLVAEAFVKNKFSI